MLSQVFLETSSTFGEFQYCHSACVFLGLVISNYDLNYVYFFDQKVISVQSIPGGVGYSEKMFLENACSLVFPFVPNRTTS